MLQDSSANWEGLIKPLLPPLPPANLCHDKHAKERGLGRVMGEIGEGSPVIHRLVLVLSTLSFMAPKPKFPNGECIKPAFLLLEPYLYYPI